MGVDIIQLIQTLGFPIVVTLWFMYRTDKVITENTIITKELKEVIVAYCRKD
jgi:hypothetical protein